MYKILHVISDKNIGGAGVLLLSLLRHTDRSRFEPILVLPKGSRLLPRARALGVRCTELENGGDKTFSAAAVFDLFCILRNEKPHILHTNASLSARLAALPFRRTLTVDTKHCCFAPSPLQKSRWARTLNRALERASDVHYILTADAARIPLLLRGGSAARATVICGGAERVLPLDETEKRALRAELGLGEQDFVVGYAARVELGKGHEHLLLAARRLQDQKNIRFLVVGEGTLLPEIQKRAKTLPNVIFTGFREDIGRVMNLFDLSLNLSYLSETSPLSLSEGMSLGIPLVVTDIGGNADMAKECGLVIPPRAPNAVADAILRLKNDPTLYTALSKGAKRRYADYSAEGMTQKTETLYRNLLSKKAIKF